MIPLSHLSFLQCEQVKFRPKKETAWDKGTVEPVLRGLWIKGSPALGSHFFWDSLNQIIVEMNLY